MKLIFVYPLILLAALNTVVSGKVKNKYAEHEPVEHINRDYPSKWEQLVPGGRFMDRFLPMPGSETRRGQTWGVEGVQDRFVDNGIENPDFFFWGAHITQAADGHYDMFCSSFVNTDGNSKCITKIHRAVSDNRSGPYKTVETLGWGHAPELHQTNEGKYFIPVYLTQPVTSYAYYLADSPEGPWTMHPYDYDYRGRECARWGQNNMLATQSYAKRSDGSFVAVIKGGSMLISKDGISTYRLVNGPSVYPKVEARFEDPTIWRDNVQYHLVVNDWQGRVAWYLRSKDCMNWVVDPGFAIARGATYHPDGEVEEWCKYERFKVFQDEYGRAVQANMVGIDVPKNEIFTAHYQYIRAFEKPTLDTDGHFSKQLCIPLNPGMLMKWVDACEFESAPDLVRILIQKEPGFDPVTDVDVPSLRFGANEQVNYGRGARPVGSEVTVDGLIVSFKMVDTKITRDEFAPKVIGNDNDGQMIFGYTRVPWIDYEAPVMSPLCPTRDGANLGVVVENMGPGEAAQSTLSVYVQRDGQKTLFGEAKVAPLPAYESQLVTVVPRKDVAWHEKDQFTIEILEGQANFSSIDLKFKEYNQRKKKSR